MATWPVHAFDELPPVAAAARDDAGHVRELDARRHRRPGEPDLAVPENQRWRQRAGRRLRGVHDQFTRVRRANAPRG